MSFICNENIHLSCSNVIIIIYVYSKPWFIIGLIEKLYRIEKCLQIGDVNN